MSESGPLQVLAMLPWYVHVLLGVMVLSLLVTKVLPFLRTAKRIVSTKKYLHNPKGSALSLEQRRALSVGAIGAEQQGFFVDTLETGQNASDLRGKLQEWWDISSRDTAQQTLQWLSERGHRGVFDGLLQVFLEVPTTERKRVVAQQFAGEERAAEYLENLGAALKTLQQEGVVSGREGLRGTTLAWDLGRLAMVARSCHTAGYLTEPQAWSLIERAHAEATRSFADWESFSRSFLIGRAMWGGDDLALPGLCSIGRGLQQDAESPWRSAPLR
ncbi:MAG: DUF1266 domain-containing protein [Myxococcales bacterium]|nr:MAG: DUF1266 domain-containing protein [Myxococcales bacterium]